MRLGRKTSCILMAGFEDRPVSGELDSRSNLVPYIHVIRAVSIHALLSSEHPDPM